MTSPNDDEEYQAHVDELANDDPTIFKNELIADLMPKPADLDAEIARALSELDHQQVHLTMSDDERRAVAVEIAKQRVQVAGVKSRQTELLKDESRRETRALRANMTQEDQLKEEEPPEPRRRRVFASDEYKHAWAERAVHEWRKNPRQSARQLAQDIVKSGYKKQMFEQIYEVVLSAINVEKARPR